MHDAATRGQPMCTATQQVGKSCVGQGTLCDPGLGCGVNLVCAISDPTKGPGGCPISRARYKEDIRAAGGDESKPPRSVVILRVDRECPFEKTYAIMRAVRLAKYERVQLRVVQYGGQLKS